MIDLVDLATAKAHLHIDSDAEDSDVQLKILAASAILFNYLKVNSDTSPLSLPWTGDVPFDIEAACLLIIGELYLNREAASANVLSPTVIALVHRYRDPAMA